MNTSTSAVERTMSRDLALDAAKGLGVILVVVGHAWRGVDSAGLIGNADLFRVIDTLIYNFHMPLFFILSGMTFQAWALRRPASEAAINRVTRLLWPLLLWTYLFAAARLVAGGTANTQVEGLESLLFWPMPPREHLWFLWALFLQHLVILALIRFVTGPLSAPVWAALASAVVLATSFFPIGLNAWTFGAKTYAGAFLAGLALGQVTWRPSGPLAIALAAAIFVGLQTLSFQMPATRLTSQVLGIVLSLACLTLVIAISNSSQESGLRLLTWLGVSSMGIFLAHTIFSVGTRTALGRFTTDLTLHMIIGTLAGIIGPLIIYSIIRRVGRPSWIGF